MSDEQQPGFAFEGRPLAAQPGQSIAGALHAAGVRTLSRSVKYHRPRGYTCGFGACGDCLVQIDGMPSSPSCTTAVTGGEKVRREQGVPSAGFDLLRFADLLRPMLRAGFQFALFARQPRLSRLAGRVMAVLAGGGRMPSAAAAQRSSIERVERLEPPVLVIGGGVSGLTAALAAAEAGGSVVLVDQEFIGGRGRVRTERILDDGIERLPAELVDELLARARAHAGIRLIRGQAIGWIDGVVPVVDAATRTRYELSPGVVVLATGSYEVPVAVAGHDLPGVMLADGALRLAEIERVAPGRRAVVIADDPRAEAVAERLRGHGVQIVAVVPSARVRRITGWSRATGVIVSEGGASRRIRADLVCVAGPRRRAEELALHVAYTGAGSHELVMTDQPAFDGGVAVVGSAAGDAGYSLSEIRAVAAALATRPRGDARIRPDQASSTAE